MEELENILQSMSSISLEEMSAVKLMNRVDSKFPMNRETLLRMSSRWGAHFYVQEHEGQRIAHYRSLYFDTPDAITYTMHHNRRLRRQKIRQRHRVPVHAQRMRRVVPAGVGREQFFYIYFCGFDDRFERHKPLFLSA